MEPVQRIVARLTDSRRCPRPLPTVLRRPVTFPMSKTGNPKQRVDALLQQALALHQNGAHALAEELYREILGLRPRHFDAMQLLGTIALQTGRLEEGVEWLTQAVAVDPRQASLYSNLAFAFNALRRFGDGLASADRALALKPDFVDALNNRGNALAGLDRSVEALASFERVIALQGANAEAWNNRACVLRDLGRPLDAVQSCDRAIALRQDYADAWSNRGNAFSDLNQPIDAQASYQRALELQTEFADAWSNLGLTLVDLGQHANALQCYERALAIRPDSIEAHWNEALCRLETGDFERGWRAYEWRWERHTLRDSKRSFDVPLWLGDAPVAGKTILLHAEQGLGDTLQFCRYAAEVAALGATVLLEVPAALMRLLAGVGGVSQLIEEGSPLPSFDLHCPLLSLPLAFGTRLETIPGKTPYLFADAAGVQKWCARVKGGEVKADEVKADEAKQHQAKEHGVNALKVGLVWAGGHRPHVPELRKNDARRSITLQHLSPLLDVPNVQFYSLQMGNAAREVKSTASIIDFTDDLYDFADTAALIANLDLVISVDTSTAHLAGAMNSPVWILNRFDTCWRWLLERDDSPWYPSATLFRQPSLGDWDSVIAKVRDALRARAEAHRLAASAFSIPSQIPLR